MSKPSEDKGRIVVVGAGLVGLAAAAELARRGHSVTVLEKSIPGAEASTAAAGILGPQLEHDDDGPTLDLGLEGARATARLVKVLEQEVAADVDLITTPALKLATTDAEATALSRRVRWQKERGLRVEMLTPKDLPIVVGEQVVSAASFPDDHCLDPRAYGAALHALVQNRGVTLRTGTLLASVVVRGGKCHGVALADGTEIAADHVLVCAGAWSSRIPGLMPGLKPDDVKPVRGLIVELKGPPGVVDRVIFGEGGYLVPRRDGRVLCGSTMEDAGFDKSVSAAGVANVLARAIKVMPQLAAHAFSSTWAGLRPGTRDGLPLLGETGVSGLWLSTGHFRNGVLLAAVSAEIVSALIDGDASAESSASARVDVARFSPKRLQSVA